MKKTDVAWAAGFFDGEGSIYIKNGIFKDLRIGQKIAEPLYKFQKIFPGGNISHYLIKTPKGKDSEVYFYILSAHPAQIALALMLPYLTVKRDLAKSALAIRKSYYNRDMARLNLIAWYRTSGYTYQQIADLLNLSKQRIHQLLDIAVVNNLIDLKDTKYLQNSFVNFS